MVLECSISLLYSYTKVRKLSGASMAPTWYSIVLNMRALLVYKSTKPDAQGAASPPIRSTQLHSISVHSSYKSTKNCKRMSRIGGSLASTAAINWLALLVYKSAKTDAKGAASLSIRSNASKSSAASGSACGGSRCKECCSCSLKAGVSRVRLVPCEQRGK